MISDYVQRGYRLDISPPFAISGLQARGSASTRFAGSKHDGAG
ncbi:MAG: hypothetical protein SV375_11120 [Thermodesulfobacteriota bacterium]|nr:hypothetical protein [Thermodesulfobacteriota bacterium]